MILNAVLAPLAAIALAGGGGPPSHVVKVVATDYHLAMPASLPAGPTSFQVVNHGREPHQVYLVQLRDGRTMTDLVSALRAGGPPPAWAVDAGGPNAVDPGGTSTVTTVRLVPGTYAALCVIPSPDGTPHVMKGMINSFTVTPVSNAAAVEARPDRTVTMVDYGYDLSAPLTAGPHQIEVRNAGKQSHELVLARLAPGKTVKDLAAWVEKMDGPPPASFLGGVSPLAPGGRNLLSVSLTPGHYAFLCFLPDAKDGKPHIAHGMGQEFEVK
ncbi:MAG TPA: hypothetical protein VFL93_12220 [Longimicrobiaceae bacterium]|nr:hypothetical protein [Longimicrobiaceae bacterium]